MASLNTSKPTVDESSTSSVPSPSRIGLQYPDLVDNRLVIPGRMVFFNSQQHVYERLVHRGWENLCILPTPCYPDLVRNFYAHAFITGADLKTIHSRVNSCPVSFTVDDIARIFNLRKESRSQHPMPIEVLRTQLPLIVSALKGYANNNNFNLKYHDLTDEYRFLYEIAIANLIPTTRTTHIPVDICAFLYNVMSGSSLDIATIIWDTIADGINSIGYSWTPFPFGSVISHILFKQHVMIPYDEVSSSPIDPIGSVKMIYLDSTDCNSFGDIGVALSLLSKNLHKDIDRIFSHLDRFERLNNSLGALHSRVDHQEVVYKRLINGGYLSYEEEEKIERPSRADD